MDLELIALKYGRYKPFDEHDGFTDRWWNGPAYGELRYQFYKVLGDGAEVARVELDEDIASTPHYKTAPKLGSTGLEIQFIEVAEGHRGQGIGTAVVHRLAELHSDRRLAAFSEEADDFWESLGWEPHEGPPQHRVLFIQPA